MNIIQRRNNKKIETRYPDRGASVETESRLRSEQDHKTKEPNEPLIQSAATDDTRDRQ